MLKSAKNTNTRPASAALGANRGGAGAAALRDAEAQLDCAHVPLAAMYHCYKTTNDTFLLCFEIEHYRAIKAPYLTPVGAARELPAPHPDRLPFWMRAQRAERDVASNIRLQSGVVRKVSPLSGCPVIDS